MKIEINIEQSGKSEVELLAKIKLVIDEHLKTDTQMHPKTINETTWIVEEN